MPLGRSAGRRVTPKSGRRMFSMLKGSDRGLGAVGGGDRGSLDSCGDRGEGGGGLRASCEGGVGGNAGLIGAAMTIAGDAMGPGAAEATCC